MKEKLSKLFQIILWVIILISFLNKDYTMVIIFMNIAILEELDSMKYIYKRFIQGLIEFVTEDEEDEDE